MRRRMQLQVTRAPAKTFGQTASLGSRVNIKIRTSIELPSQHPRNLPSIDIYTNYQNIFSRLCRGKIRFRCVFVWILLRPAQQAPLPTACQPLANRLPTASSHLSRTRPACVPGYAPGIDTALRA